jgi:hypothetical protein
MRKTVLLLLLLVLAVGTAQGGVIFSDSLDTKTVGSGIHFLAPEVGSYLWVDYSQVWYGYDGGVVSNDVAKSGENSLKVYRQVDPLIYPYPTAQGDYGRASMPEPDGDPFSFKVSWYGEREYFDRPSITIDFETVSGGAGGVTVWNDNEYRVYDGGAYHQTGVYAQYGVWNDIEFIATPSADAGGGWFNVTLDVFLNADGGPTVQLADDLPSAAYWQWVAEPADYWKNARMMLLMDSPLDGVSATVYYDDVSIETIPEPTTVALLGLGVFGLIRRKRS